MEQLGARGALIYFVSSNSHSLVNVMTAVAREFESDIVDWIAQHHPELDEERRKLEAGHIRASRHNWLYYGARQLLAHHPDRNRILPPQPELSTATAARPISS